MGHTGSTGEKPGRSRPGESEAAVRTFLIVDVRGYTRFTQERGDEAAGRLAGDFAELARETVLSAGGELIELRGDEALCVFGSARQALRGAVELQRRFRRRADGEPAFPLPVGIGLDAGEAVEIEGGYRGGALNTAARLCSLAGPGQILASETVVSLSRRVEGIRFVERRPARVKGLDKPVRVVEVVPEGGLPPLPLVRPAGRAWLSKGRLAAAAALAALAIAGVAALAWDRGSVHVVPNSIVRIDPETNEIVEVVRVGEGAAAVASAGGHLWVANSRDDTLTHVDTRSGATRTVGGFPYPQSLAAEGQRIWVGNNSAGEVVAIDAATGIRAERVRIQGSAASFVTYGGGSLWVVEEEVAIYRINPATRRVTRRWPDDAAHEIAFGHGAAWVVKAGPGELLRIDAKDLSRKRADAGSRPDGVAVGRDAVWVASSGSDEVRRVQPFTATVSTAVDVGDLPLGVAAGPDAVWVANHLDGTVSRIDPATNTVVATISTGFFPTSVHVGAGGVWVTVLEDKLF